MLKHRFPGPSSQKRTQQVRGAAREPAFSTRALKMIKQLIGELCMEKHRRGVWDI